MHSSTIVGYVYGADIWCPADTLTAILADRVDDPHAFATWLIGGVPLTSWIASGRIPGAIDRVASWRGIDSQDERSYDSGDFPKVIFADSAHDTCIASEGYLPGQCGDSCNACREPLGGECPNEPVPSDWLDEFITGYAHCMLWANTREYCENPEDCSKAHDLREYLAPGLRSCARCGNGGCEPVQCEGHESYPEAWQTPADGWQLRAFTEKSQVMINTDCIDFARANWSDLQDLDAEQSGHDFALSRNGHGTGFFDRGYGDKGTRLQEASRVYGESCASYGENDTAVSLDDEPAENTDQ